MTSYAVEVWIEQPGGAFTYHVMHVPVARVTPVDATRHPIGEPTTFGPLPPEEGTP